MIEIHTFTQDGQDELVLYFKSRKIADKVKDILEHKRLGMMWVEEWTGAYGLRIEINDKSQSDKQ